MPQLPQHNLAFLCCEIDAAQDGAVPSEAHLLPPGPFRAEDGRPKECAAWLLDAKIAAKLIALADTKKSDMLVDYEHQSLRAAMNGKPVPAAGWCPNTLEWREGKGLYAVGITWTAKAARKIAAKEYRYISCVFVYDPKTGEVLEIISFCLTNTPAVDGMEALASMAFGSDFLRNTPSNPGDKQMDDKDKQITALSSENGAMKTQVAALTADKESLTKQVADLTSKNTELAAKVAANDQEKAAAALAADKAKHAELLQAALTDGRIPPALKEWAEKKSLADLTEYLEAQKPLAMLSKQTSGKGDEAGNHGLNEAELAACSMAGLTPEEFAKQKKQ